MAKTKAKGSTKLGRDSHSKRLGVKLYGGELAYAGNVIIRQRGTKYHPGQNVRRGSDDTLYALTDGIVAFTKRPKTAFTGKRGLIQVVNVFPKQ